ncbi:MAG: acetyl-CoA acetyltransferase [Actinomycetota bacterium]|nr:acetyl-CoA acetyltransferase [Actinomycetota bacterium]
MTLDPRTPVLVGVAQCKQRPQDVAEAVEAVKLMEQAVVAAAEDAGAPGLLVQLDAIAVVNGAWGYSDPGRLIGDAVGSPQARTVISSTGGNSPQSLVSHLSSRIQAGELSCAVITGAETIWSRRKQRAAGLPRNLTEQSGVAPDEQFQTEVQMSSEFEDSRGLEMPVNLYPVFESAFRHARGESIEAHRDRLAELWAGFNQVAVQNPYAWIRTPMTAAEIREASPSNRMVGFPYTKAMNSNWNLDQGAALLLCSAEAAEAAGVPRDRWVFPHAGTDAHDTYLVSNRRDLHSSPAVNEAARVLFELTGRSVADIDHVDVYSCFPSAVQVAATEIGLGLDRPLTVTGGLTFAGGPLNNYVTHSIATMADVLRSDAGSLGLVTANGGYLTKHALGLYSTEPADHPFVTRDVQQAVDRVPVTPVDASFVGAGTIEGYTVMHGNEGPERALAAVRTPGGARTWANGTNLAVMAELTTNEGVGRACTVHADGTFDLS